MFHVMLPDVIGFVGAVNGIMWQECFFLGLEDTVLPGLHRLKHGKTIQDPMVS